MVRQILSNETVEFLDGELSEAAYDFVQFSILLNEVRWIKVVSQLDSAGPTITPKQSGGGTKYM